MKLFQRLFFVLVVLSLSSQACAEIVTGQAAFKSWSGYWWPSKTGELVRGFVGSPSPLEKYDHYTMGRYPGPATAWAMQRSNKIYDPSAEGWNGLCHAWANAALLEDVDFAASSLGGVFWRVADKKGLLTLAHSDDLKLDQSWLSDPRKLHFFLLTYLKEQGLGIGIDLDPGNEFWSHPLYRFEMDISSGASTDFVTCTVFYADYLPVYNEQHTTIERSKTYTYRLTKDGAGQYVSGEWTGSSVTDHPGYIWVPISQNTRCPSLDHDVVLEIAHSRDDPLEGLAAVPGHHCLVVYPGEQDLIPIQVPAGTRSLDLWLGFDTRSPGTRAEYELTRGGEAISSGSLSGTLSRVSLADPDAGQYQLLVHPGSSRGAVSVNMYLDLGLANTHLLPLYPATAEWQGLALASRDQGLSSNRVHATIMGDNGLPLSLAAAPLVLAGQSKWSGLIPLDQRNDVFSGAAPKALKITSERGLSMLHLVGSSGLLQSPPATASPAVGTQKVVPFLTDQFNRDRRATLHLANTGQAGSALEVTLHPDVGQALNRSLSLGQAEVVEYAPGSYFGSSNLEGWALIHDPAGVVAGNVLLAEDGVRSDALPLLTPATRLHLPHLMFDSYWRTRMGLYNPSGEWLDITLQFNNQGQVLDSVVSLPPWGSRELVLYPGRWGLTTAEMNAGWLSLTAESAFAGWFGYQGGETLALLPLYESSEAGTQKRLCHVASDYYWWTGLALVNTGQARTDVTLIALDQAGAEVDRTTRSLGPGEKLIGLTSQLFEASGVESLRLSSPHAVEGFALYGSHVGGGMLAALPL